MYKNIPVLIFKNRVDLDIVENLAIRQNDVDMEMEGQDRTQPNTSLKYNQLNLVKTEDPKMNHLISPWWKQLLWHAKPLQEGKGFLWGFQIKIYNLSKKSRNWKKKNIMDCLNLWY